MAVVCKCGWLNLASPPYVFWAEPRVLPLLLLGRGAPVAPQQLVDVAEARHPVHQPRHLPPNSASTSTRVCPVSSTTSCSTATTTVSTACTATSIPNRYDNAEVTVGWALHSVTLSQCHSVTVPSVVCALLIYTRQ